MCLQRQEGASGPLGSGSQRPMVKAMAASQGGASLQEAASNSQGRGSDGARWGKQVEVPLEEMGIPSISGVLSWSAALDHPPSAGMGSRRRPSWLALRVGESRFPKGLAGVPVTGPTGQRLAPPRLSSFGTRPQQRWRGRPHARHSTLPHDSSSAALIPAHRGREGEQEAWTGGRLWPGRLSGRCCVAARWRCRAGCCTPGRARRKSARSWTASGASAATSPTTDAGASRSRDTGSDYVNQPGLELLA
ncbi:uncharacterized protein [Chlorocebus sabaeus]|uniref:uncharacterized protein n=1 Tax=Chlorocebus sabaeus TaxID=60711 RepID=UPI003BFA03E2